MPSDAVQILESAIIPESLFSDDYSRFIEERSALLADRLSLLIE
jgi:hypothetical protein